MFFFPVSIPILRYPTLQALATAHSEELSAESLVQALEVGLGWVGAGMGWGWGRGCSVQAIIFSDLGLHVCRLTHTPEQMPCVCMPLLQRDKQSCVCCAAGSAS